MKKMLVLLILLLSSTAWADIPATPVMTLYRFNGALDIPYYDIKTFRDAKSSKPAGTLIQGTSLVPCVPVNNGRPLTNSQGIPYVGFQVIVDPRSATPAATERFKKAVKQRQSLMVANHQCDAKVQYALDVRNLYAMTQAPYFDPPVPAKTTQIVQAPHNDLDQIIRAFHNSNQCDSVNRRLTKRRSALEAAWDRFIRNSQGRWSNAALQQAKHLDYTMRTALYEGHLGRGCNAYGACERTIIALSIRNRGREACAERQGCREPGDFQGLASKVSQYNIWDEYLTQISGLTSCFLRDDLAGENSDSPRNYSKLQSMYAQSLPDVERIVYGNDQDLKAIFPKNSLADLKNLRHYYHAPAMGKCFPTHNRVEYMSGAIARKGKDVALIANTRIRVDQQTEGGYFFRQFVVKGGSVRDDITIVDTYPGFIVDERRVFLKVPSGCPPYGIPSGCRFETVGRYRKVPSWGNDGKPLEVICQVADRGADCQAKEAMRTAKVGGVCDTEMRPFAGVR